MGGWEHWSNQQKGVTVFFGTIAAVATGIMAVPPAWTQLGLPRVAMETYVEQRLTEYKRELVGTQVAQAKVQKELSAVRLDINYMRRNQIDGEKLRLERELSQADGEGYRQLIRQRLRQLDDESRILEVQNEDLRKQN